MYPQDITAEHPTNRSGVVGLVAGRVFMGRRSTHSSNSDVCYSVKGTMRAHTIPVPRDEKKTLCANHTTP